MDKVQNALDALDALMEEFKNRRKGDMWKRIYLSIGEVFPECREEVFSRLRLVVGIEEKSGPTKAQRAAAGDFKRKGQTTPKSDTAPDEDCPTCPPRSTPRGMSAQLSTDEINKRKEGRKGRLGGNYSAGGGSPFLSPQDVLERFESNIIAMMNFCIQSKIVVTGDKSAEQLANIIFKNYRP